MRTGLSVSRPGAGAGGQESTGPYSKGIAGGAAHDLHTQDVPIKFGVFRFFRGVVSSGRQRSVATSVFHHLEPVQLLFNLTKVPRR